MKIALGDLKHRTIGRHSNFMPLGISYIASYILANIESKDIEVRTYNNPNVIFKDIPQWKPDVIGLSNYCWNSELSNLVFNYAKNVNPNIICVSGGPEFPKNKNDMKKYLLKRGVIDFYVHYEGEVAFTKLINKILKGYNLDVLKSEPHENIVLINPQTKEVIIGEIQPRLKDLDVIPSPYLNGLMDQWFNGKYAPSIQTNRGCPFTCGYCYEGQNYYRKVAHFSLSRVKKELSYIAQKMQDYPNVLLSICDSNFGMFKRDENIAEHIRNLQDDFGWPNAFDVTTGKANHSRILRIASLLKNKMYISGSVQSLNLKTQKVMKRKNIPMKQYKEVQKEISKRDMRSVAELIIPMPEETKVSFFEGVEKLINIGVKNIVPYTTMLLKGTFLTSKECRNRYQMQTKFRLLPRQFGEYLKKKCFEIEEVCIGTNTFSFHDYLEHRGFALIASLLSSEQFNIIYKHLKELKISFYDFLMSLWETIRSGEVEVSKAYHRFIDETKSELWDSRESLIDYYTNQKNYGKLLEGKLGDNLIRKYKSIIFLKYSGSMINLLYQSIEDFAEDTLFIKGTRESLDAAKRWILACRDLKKILRLKDEDIKDSSEILNLNYDVYSWYISNSKERSLISYKKDVSYRISTDVERITRILSEGKKLYGNNFLFRVGKLLISRSAKIFWNNCKTLKKPKSLIN